MTWQEDEFRMIVDSEHQFYRAYIEGLSRGGWQGEQDESRLSYLYVFCGYGMMLAGISVALGDNLSRHDLCLERSGEQNAEAAFDSYSSRLELLEPLAEELLSLAT